MTTSVTCKRNGRLRTWEPRRPRAPLAPTTLASRSPAGMCLVWGVPEQKAGPSVPGPQCTGPGGGQAPLSPPRAPSHSRMPRQNDTERPHHPADLALLACNPCWPSAPLTIRPGSPEPGPRPLHMQEPPRTHTAARAHRATLPTRRASGGSLGCPCGGATQAGPTKTKLPV